MLSTADEEPDSPFGWRVVGGAHVVTAVTFGSAYSFAALFPGLSEEFSASRGEIALVFSIAAFVFYAIGAIAGPLADRFSPGRLVTAGLVAMVLGYAAAGQARTLPMLYAAYGAGVGLGIGLSYVPAISSVQSWFARRRAQASGIATAGLGLGTLVLPLAIGRIVPEFGWRNCFMILATIVCVLGLPAAALIRRRAEPMRSGVPPAGTISPVVAWRTPGFPRFYAAIVLASFCIFIPYGHIVSAAQDLGVSLAGGTTLIALIGIGNFIGRFALAGLGDRVGPARLLAILTGILSTSFLLWAFAGGYVSLAVFSLIFGAAYGGCVGLYPAVAADLFGTRSIGAMLGYLYTGVGIAALLGPSAAGFAFDRTGTYLGPILASAAAAAIAAVLTINLQPDQRRHADDHPHPEIR